MQKNYSIIFLFILISLHFVLFTDYSYSYPKFAAYTGEKCVTCHVNPTGGGMRNLYGVKYSKDNLYFKFLEKANKTMEISTRITKGITIGADMRFAYFDDQTGAGNPNFNTFFQMQGDLYVNGKINKYINLVIAPGLYIPNTFYVQPNVPPAPVPTKYEIYGMLSNLPAGLYVKMGRFIPNFGIRLPEHREYSRIYNDFYTPYAADAGIEMGISPGLFTLTAGFSNGSSYNIKGENNNSFDFDTQKQITVSGDFRWASRKTNFTFGLGGSFLSNPFKFDPDNNINALRQIAAGFFSFGLFQRVAVLGEITYNRLKLRDSALTKNDFRTLFGEVDARVMKGLELKFQYENYDPALGTKNDPSERQRYSFGAVLFPLTGVDIEAVYRVVKAGKGSGPVPFTIQANEFQTVFKFYF